MLLALLLLLTLAMILAEKLKVISRKERKPKAEKLLPGPQVPPDLGSTYTFRVTFYMVTPIFTILNGKLLSDDKRLS